MRLRTLWAGPLATGASVLVLASCAGRGDGGGGQVMSMTKPTAQDCDSGKHFVPTSPVSSDDSARLMQVFQGAQAEGDFSTGISGVLQAMLLSPRFLFVLEEGQSGAAGAAVPLTPTEVAARLSLFFWRSAPDDTLA